MGAAAALGAAVFWAATNLILRQQIAKLGGATAQAWRTVVSTLVFGLIFLALRDPRDLLTIPLRTLGILLLSVLLSMVIGDILQFTAVRRLGIALAMPIASCYPLFTLVIAAVTLAEAPTVRSIVGALLVIAGVILVALPRRSLVEELTPQAAQRTAHWTGVAFALGSPVCVAGATALTRVAIKDFDILTANMFRLPFSATLCTLISTVERRQPPWRVERQSILSLCLAGFSGLASGLCYLSAIKLVGASTTATLNAAGPIFGLLGAVVFLRERPTQRNIAGTLIAFLGVALVA